VTSGFVVLFVVVLFCLFSGFGSLPLEGSRSYAPPTYRKKKQVNVSNLLGKTLKAISICYFTEHSNFKKVEF